MSERKICIRPEAFGVGFDVNIEPPAPWARYDQERPTHRSARRYAESLRTIYPDWRIVDETGDFA